jgi:hypothetical protein
MFSTRALSIALLILLIVGAGALIRQCRRPPAVLPKPPPHQALPEE